MESGLVTSKGVGPDSLCLSTDNGPSVPAGQSISTFFNGGQFVFQPGGGIAVSSIGNLYVADTNNNRVLEYQTPITSGGTSADLALGQADLLHNGANGLVGSALLMSTGGVVFGPNGNGFVPQVPGIAIDSSGHLYLADTNNSRVLGWKAVSSLTNGQPADLVIGQPEFNSWRCNQNSLVGSPTAGSLCYPEGLAVDGAGDLYVADTGNTRVLEYATPFASCLNFPCVAAAAEAVFGQGGDFTATSCGTGKSGLCYPRAIGVDAGRNLYVSDTGNNRVLEYNAPTSGPAPNTTADLVFGQDGSFTSNACNAVGADSLCQPTALVADVLSNLYVADTLNDRLLEYNTPLNRASGEKGAGDTVADSVFGQGGSFPSSGCYRDNPPPSALCAPTGVGLDSKGNLWVADSGYNNVFVFLNPLRSGDTDLGLTFEGGSGADYGDLCIEPSAGTFCLQPTNALGNSGLAGSLGLDSHNNLFLVDDYNNRVLEYLQPLVATPTPIATGTPTSTPTATNTATPTPTATWTPEVTDTGGTPTATATPRPTGTATPTPTATPFINSISPSVVSVGGSFTINGLNFTAGSVVNFFVATANGPVNAGPFTPTSLTLPTHLTIDVPATAPLGEGFVALQVVNTDRHFANSNIFGALLIGSASAGIPSITGINGVGLDPTSSNPAYATNNVSVVVAQGSTVTVNGSGFNPSGVAINLFAAGGNYGFYFIGPGPNLSNSTAVFTLPASGLHSPPTGPGSFQVINTGSGSFKVSNAVAAVIGARIGVLSVTQSGSTLTVNGTGFSKLTVINFFNTQGAGVVKPWRARPRRRGNSANVHKRHPAYVHRSARSRSRTFLCTGAQPAVRSFQ